MNRARIFTVIALAVVISSWFIFDLGDYFTLANAKAQQQSLIEQIQNAPILSSLAYFALYVLITALSLPGAAIVTLLSGALFGFWWALILVSFASSIGATLAFLLSRFLLRDWVSQRFGERFKAINQGVEKDGPFYLLTLRLIPIFPFFLINLALGLTQMKTRTFYWVSQLGMLLGTAVYINAGTQLGQIESLGDIVSAPILISFTLLGLFPLMAKKIISLVQNRRIYQAWQDQKPKQFDRNLIVIGAGAGGLVSAYIAATVKAKVTLIEKDKMGGDCLNTGCVPSKALIRAAGCAHEIAQSQRFGLTSGPVSVDFEQVMAHVHQAITDIEPHDSIERYSQLGVECITGNAQILSPWHVRVNDQTLSCQHMVIATGASPWVPEFEGVQASDFYTSDTLWKMTTQPKKLLLLGGGPIGCELAQSFCRLGSDVHLLELAEQLLIREDSDCSDMVAQQLNHDGVHLHLGSQVQRIEKTEQGYRVHIQQGEQTSSFEVDCMIAAIGRRAHTQGFGLENLELDYNANGTIKVNDYLQTKFPNIFAVGDVAGPYQLTHAASHQAWHAAVNALFGIVKKFKVSYQALPAVTYTAPELARVGLNEKEALAQGIAFEVTRFDIGDLDRALADRYKHGLIKVLTVQGKDKILGATIVGPHAGELLCEYTLAMRHGLGLNKILATVHPYPTLSEANKYVAGEWKRAHAPERLMPWLERFHTWRRKK
ncbi:Soluble pyridine nucleotide transhydrogenase [Vibrio stylophorae]|uniref:Soluble pyridine nucleotide transhydrogenase n=1 Tax=Vibrio stylophorae TaxID=659351 RepID=A0ABN8DQP8_9VIBR|nr:bifunctional TVP38/TMEM64 family protein/FAD-dependent oxidoreductase [Vibrio stylophorae]CAH0533045.1 Soluble pyridine nucleotide transhydrogenase [Vibrio stylophorae]